MRFRACVVIGDQKGRVSYGVGKGADVTAAVQKGVTKAKKQMISVNLTKDSIPHEVRIKYGAAKILLKPAPRGTGIKAGGPVRAVLELAGVQNVVSKILGSSNKTSNVKAAYEALKLLKKVSGKKNGEKKND